MKRQLLTTLAALVSFCLHANSVTNAKTNMSIFTPDTWGVSAFSAEDDYVLANDYLYANGVATFGGNSFHVANNATFQPNNNTTPADFTFPNDGIFFDVPSALRHWQASDENAELTFRGSKMTIGNRTTGNNLFRIGTTKKQPYGCTYIFDLPLYGSTKAYIKLAYYKTTFNGWSKLVLRGDCSDYKGVIWVDADDPISSNSGDKLTPAPEHCNELVFDNDTFGGWKIFVERRCSVTLPTNGCVKTGWFQLTNDDGGATESAKLIYRWNGNTAAPDYGRLKLEDFSEIDQSARGTVTFTSNVGLEFVVPTELAVFCAVSTENEENPYERAVTLLETKVGMTDEKKSRCRLTMTGEAPYGAESRTTPELRFTPIEDGGTRVQAVGTWPRFSRLLTGDASAAGNHGSSLLARNATNWTDGTTMDSNVAYVVTKGLQLMTHESIPAFTGDRLILEGKSGSNRSRLALISSSLDITNLYCHGGSMIQGFNFPSHITGGPIHFCRPIASGSDNDVIFMPPANVQNVVYGISLDVPIVNPDGVSLVMFYPAGDNGRSCTTIHLNQPSPDHLGGSEIGLNTSYKPAVSNPETAYLTVYFDDPLCFGGAAPSYLSNGLRVDGDQRIRPTRTMTFEDNLNRGFISADKGARLDIPEGVTLTFKQPMLWLGPLTKMGPGVFARGGTYEPRFQSSSNNDPSDYAGTSNYWFLVRGGSVMALATNAYNGVSLRFSEGGGLMVDAATTDEALKKYGIVNTKIGDPFVCAENEKIPLSFRVADSFFTDPSAPSVKVAVCTVNGDAASAALRAKFEVTQPGVAATLSAEQAEDLAGAYTVYATLTRKYMIVVPKAKDGKLELTSDAVLDLEAAEAGSYTVSKAAGCHLKWTDAGGKYAVYSSDTLTVTAGTPKNGLDSFMSYVLGLDADNASSKPYLAAVQGSGESQDKITFKFPGLNPLSESETGVTLSYKLFVSSDPTVFSTSEPVAASTTPELSADLPVDKDAPVRYYRASINL